MTDRAINFQAIVEGVRESADSSAVVTVDGPTPFDVCEALFRRFESRTDRSACEFYLNPNARRDLERHLLETRAPGDSPEFLDRQTRTDVSMPDDTVLFADPDAITLGGTVTGSSTVGIGTVSSTDAAER